MGDKGPAVEECSSCHGTSNNAFTGAPGAANWMLAPLSMAWESSPDVAMTGNQLCNALKDKSRNGGRDLTGPGAPDTCWSTSKPSTLCSGRLPRGLGWMVRQEQRRR